MSAWCGNCRFFCVGTTAAFPSADGMCRRHAPQGAVIGCHHNGFQVFPPMMAHQWCGEHQFIAHGALAKRWKALERIVEAAKAEEARNGQ